MGHVWFTGSRMSNSDDLRQLAAGRRQKSAKTTPKGGHSESRRVSQSHEPHHGTPKASDRPPVSPRHLHQRSGPSAITQQTSGIRRSSVANPVRPSGNPQRRPVIPSKPQHSQKAPHRPRQIKPPLPPRYQFSTEDARKGGLKGGKSRAAALSPEERSAAARKAVLIRWQKQKKR